MPGVPQKPNQVAVAREDLDAMVAGVRDVEVAVGPERQGANAGELARLRSRRAPALDELAVGIELGDALVFAELARRSK